MTTVFPTGDKEAFPLAPRRGPQIRFLPGQKPCYSTVGYSLYVMSLGSHHYSPPFFLSRTYNPRGRRSKDIQILFASCRKFLFSSHLHIILEDEDGARFLFFGLLIIFEDGIARLAPIFVNMARKLDDGDLAVFFMAWSIGDTTTLYVRILPSAFFSL
jgi:hypothetical protein